MCAKDVDMQRTAATHKSHSGGIWDSNALSTTEYALIVAGIAIVATGALFLLGGTLSGSFSRVNQGLAGTLPAMTITPSPAITQTGTATITAPITETATAQRPLEGTATLAAPTSTTIPREPDYLFQDFDDGDVSDWVVTRGDGWTVQAGQYCNNSLVLSDRRTFVGDPSWTDYTISIRANLFEDDGWGVYFRATNLDRPNAYIFQYDPGWGSGAFMFRKVVYGGERNPFAITWAPEDYEWYNVWRTITVRVEGDTFTALLDGAQVLQASDPDFQNGQVGLRIWADSTACFDDLTVTPLGP
jgi:Flp pilus assembly pilin Flp